MISNLNPLFEGSLNRRLMRDIKSGKIKVSDIKSPILRSKIKSIQAGRLGKASAELGKSHKDTYRKAVDDFEKKTKKLLVDKAVNTNADKEKGGIKSTSASIFDALKGKYKPKKDSKTMKKAAIATGVVGGVGVAGAAGVSYMKGKKKEKGK